MRREGPVHADERAPSVGKSTRKLLITIAARTRAASAWSIRGHGVFRFIRPTGPLLSGAPRRYVVERDPARLLVHPNRHLGPGFDSETGAWRWDGVPLDAAQAVACVFMVENAFAFRAFSNGVAADTPPVTA